MFGINFPGFDLPKSNPVRPFHKENNNYGALNTMNFTENFSPEKQNNRGNIDDREEMEELISEKDNAEKHFDEESMTERLSSIQTKLYNDAEKIRQWRISAENDLRIKEQKIKDSDKIIDTQRKTISDLQIRNEKLNQNFNEEIEHRGSITLKLQSTRELVFLVKDQMDKMNNNLTFCNEKVGYFDTLNDKRSKEIEALTEKFKSLHVQHTETISKQKDEHKKQCSSMEEQYLTEMNKAESHLNELHTILKEKHDDHQMLQVRIKDLTDSEVELHQKIETLSNNETMLKQMVEKEKQDLFDCKQKMGELESELSSRTELIAKLRDEIRVLEESETASKDIISSMQQKIYNNEQMYAENKSKMEELLTEETLRSNELERQIYNSNLTIEEITKNLEAYKSRLETVNLENNELKEAKLQLDEELKDLEQNVDQLKKQIEQFKIDIADKNSELSRVEDDLANNVASKKQLENDLKQTKQDLTKKEESVRLSEQKLDILKSDLNILQSTNENSISQIKEMGNEIESLKDLSNRSAKENDALKVSIKTKNNDLDEIKEEFEDLKTENNDLNEKLEAISVELNSTKDQVLELESALTNKSKTIDSLQNVMKSEIDQEKQTASSLESKLDSCKTELNSKIKAIKEMEKEGKMTLAKLKAKSRDFSKLEETVAEKTLMIEEKDEELNKMVAELKLVKNNMEEAKKLSENFQKERDMAKSDCDAKLKDMMRTMEKQQSEFQKDIVQKDRELQNEKRLNAELTKNSQQIDTKNSALEEAQNEIKALKEKKKTTKKEMDDLAKKNAKLVADLKKQTEDLRKANDETKKMREENKKMTEEIKILREKENNRPLPTIPLQKQQQPAAALKNRNIAFPSRKDFSPLDRGHGGGHSSDSSAVDANEIFGALKLKTPDTLNVFKRKTEQQPHFINKKSYLNIEERLRTPTPKTGDSKANPTASARTPTIVKMTAPKSTTVARPVNKSYRKMYSGSDRKFFLDEKSSSAKNKPQKNDDGCDWDFEAKKDVYDFVTSGSD